MEQVWANLHAFLTLRQWQRDLLKEDYINMTDTTIDKTTHVVQMRHRVNGNWIVLKVKGNHVQLFKNRSLIKMITF